MSRIPCCPELRDASCALWEASTWATTEVGAAHNDTATYNDQHAHSQDTGDAGGGQIAEPTSDAMYLAAALLHAGQTDQTTLG